MTDAADLLVRAANGAVAAADTAVRDKLSAAVAVGLLEAARVAARDLDRATARALVEGDGDAESVGGGRGCTGSVAAAHAFLMHADLRDDAYRTALHPGQLIIPTALAVGEARGRAGARVVAAMLFGYELTCRCADLLLPELARRGWRASAVLAPLAAAATAAHLYDDDPTVLADAVRLASAASGGTLHVVQAGADWRVQPALCLPAGLLAARLAASGYHCAEGALEADAGLFATFGPDGDPRPVDAAIDGHPRVLDVTFKRYDAPMYAQGVLDACHRLGDHLPPGAVVANLVVRVSPFTHGYAGSAQRAESIGNVAGAVLGQADRLPEPLRRLAACDVKVDADPALADTDGWVEATCADGTRVAATGTGDTARWALADVVDHYRRDLPETMPVLAEAVTDLPSADGTQRLSDAWRQTAREWASTVESGR